MKNSALESLLSGGFENDHIFRGILIKIWEIPFIKYHFQTKNQLKFPPAERRLLPSISGDFNKNFSLKVYEKQGDLFIIETKTLKIRQITNTVEGESNPVFNEDETKVIFSKSGNLFSINISDGLIAQLSNFQSGTKKEKEPALNDQEKWLKADQLANFEVLKERKDKKDEAELIAKADLPKRPKEIYYGEKKFRDCEKASPDLQYITYRLSSKPKMQKPLKCQAMLRNQALPKICPVEQK